MRRLLCLLLALVQVLPSLGAIADCPTRPSHHIGMDRQTMGTVGMGYGVTGVEHHQYLVDTSQPYAEVIQEAEWMNNALPLITRYDIGLDRLRMFKYQVTSNGPPPVYSPVLSAWYLFDGLGSTRAVVDDSGVGQSEFGYGDAFGIPYQVAANGTRATAGAGFFLNGQQWDGSGVWNSGEGLYFNRARYYQPGLGRFIGQDPYRGGNYHPITFHRYLYTSQDSVNNIDPDGRMASLVMGTGISIGIRPSEGFKISIKFWAMMRIAAIVGTTVAVSTLPGDARIEYETVYRFGDMFNPESWIPNLFVTLAKGVGGEIWGETISPVDYAKARMMKSMLKNGDNSLLGDMMNSWGNDHVNYADEIRRVSPFVSVTSDYEKVLKTPDPKLLEKLTMAPHIGIFRVPKNFLLGIGPTWVASIVAGLEGEKLYTGYALSGIPLQSYNNGYLNNPIYTGGL
jgi:RHS repeat-associated protein